jgi:hypothetical protein
MLSITEWLAICLIILIVACPLLFRDLNAQNEHYNIETMLPTIKSPCHTNLCIPSNAAIHIYEKVFDKYGTIKQAKVVYCVGDPNTCKNVSDEDRPKILKNDTMR